MSEFRRWAAVVATCGMASTGAAHAQSFGAKPGAWENTVTTSGLTIPPDVLARMPPDRRAVVEEQLRASGGGGQPQVRKTCITKENLERGFTPNPNSNCTSQVVSRTATKMTMTTSCSAPVPSTGTMTWEAKTPESVVGNIDQDIRGRKVHINIIGRWLGASCEGIEPLPQRGG